MFEKRFNIHDQESKRLQSQQSGSGVKVVVSNIYIYKHRMCDFSRGDAYTMMSKIYAPGSVRIYNIDNIILFL